MDRVRRDTGDETSRGGGSEEPADASLANVSPIYQPTQPRRRAPVNYPADDLQVAQAPAQYPVATVQTYDPGLTAGGYGDTVDGSGQSSYGYDQPGVEGYIVNQDPADSVGIYPEPVLDSPMLLLALRLLAAGADRDPE